MIRTINSEISNSKRQTWNSIGEHPVLTLDGCQGQGRAAEGGGGRGQGHGGRLQGGALRPGQLRGQRRQRRLGQGSRRHQVQLHRGAARHREVGPALYTLYTCDTCLPRYNFLLPPSRISGTVTAASRAVRAMAASLATSPRSTAS